MCRILTAIASIVCFLVGCTIPVKGPTGVSKVAAETVVGKTRFSEIKARLGMPTSVESSSSRFVANWSSVAGKMDTTRVLLGYPTGKGYAVVETLGVECDSSDVVLRKLFYNREETPRGPRDRLVLGTDPSAFNLIERSPKPKTQKEFIQRLGPPMLKLMVLRGERWVWYNIDGTNHQNRIQATFDTTGKLLSVRRN